MPLKSDGARLPRDRRQERPERPERRPYTMPTLVEYGPVAKLTQMMATGSIVDGGGGMMTCL